jgi:Holliday junction resolvasome RuvABC endonuclease subunit
MKILSMDQSTRVTGYSIFDDGNYVTSGVIDLHKIKDTEERSKQMAIEICNLIESHPSDCVVIEEVALTSNAQTLKLLARIQGVAIGFCAAHNIPLHILEPTRWRSCLGYRQGPKVKRDELKKQSLDFVKKKLGLNIKSEDENEAVAIGVAANMIYGFDDEI